MRRGGGGVGSGSTTAAAPDLTAAAQADAALYAAGVTNELRGTGVWSGLVNVKRPAVRLAPAFLATLSESDEPLDQPPPEQKAGKDSPQPAKLPAKAKPPLGGE